MNELWRSPFDRALAPEFKGGGALWLILLRQVDRQICSNRKRFAEGENPTHALPRSLGRAEQICMDDELVNIVLSAQFHTEILYLP